jgi:hypothetical protein
MLYSVALLAGLAAAYPQHGGPPSGSFSHGGFNPSQGGGFSGSPFGGHGGPGGPPNGGFSWSPPGPGDGEATVFHVLPNEYTDTTQSALPAQH